MISRLRKMMRDERGITGLETAIILIAFVVVAAVFAFTVLSAGVFSSERGKEAVYAGLAEVQGSLEIRGSVLARAVAAGGNITDVIFSLANVAGGEPVDFSTTDRVIIIEYRDEDQRHEITDWTVTWPGYDDGDSVLEDRELAELTVPLSGTITTDLDENRSFVIEVKPPQGGTLVIERTTPSYIDPINDLH